MKSLFICSTSGHAGKRMLCVGIGKKLMDKKLKLGYFKPIGIFPIRAGREIFDEDVLLFKALFKLKESVNDICPISLTASVMDGVLQNKMKGIKSEILDAYERIAKNKEIVLINGLTNLFSGTFLGLSSLEFARTLKAKTILTGKYTSNEHEMLDEFLNGKSLLKDHLLGVVINRVPTFKMEHVEKKLIPFLKAKGIDVFGIIPDDPILSAVSVTELQQILGGDVISCPKKMDILVERFLVGAMTMESALKFFRRVDNKAVITGGDRPDIQLAALETKTRCLILTGGLYPNDIIISKSEEKDIPIMVVKCDTLTTVEKCESLIGHFTISNERKINRAMEVVAERFNFKKLGQAWGQTSKVR